MITVNGQTYTGSNVTISNGKVIIDGERVDTSEAKEINIIVNRFQAK